jgi:hypothetical protein
VDLDSFFGWYFTHNTLLINGVIVAILGLIGLTLFFSLWKSKTPDAGSLATTGAIDELEKTLRRVLDTVPSRPAAEMQKATSLIQDDDESKQAVQAAAAHAAAAEFQSMVESLKKDAGEKDKVIQSLKGDLEKIASSGGLSDEQKSRLAALEKELEVAKSRLSEYEIIEDDIANLSLYKAENSQLKSELDKLRRQKVIKDDPNNIPQVSDIVAEFAAIVGAEDNPKSPLRGPGSNPKAEAEKIAAVQPAAPAPAPAAAAPKPAPAPQAAPRPSPAPTAPAGEVAEGAALEIDPNKLIAEATSLPDASESGEEGKEEDSKQKLINEFESFIKNG